MIKLMLKSMIAIRGINPSQLCPLLKTEKSFCKNCWNKSLLYSWPGKSPYDALHYVYFGMGYCETQPPYVECKGQTLAYCLYYWWMDIYDLHGHHNDVCSQFFTTVINCSLWMETQVLLSWCAKQLILAKCCYPQCIAHSCSPEASSLPAEKTVPSPLLLPGREREALDKWHGYW